MAKQPAHKMKLGLITATIWDNDGSYSVDLTRSYKNRQNEWKNTSGKGVCAIAAAPHIRAPLPLTGT